MSKAKRLREMQAEINRLKSMIENKDKVIMEQHARIEAFEKKTYEDARRAREQHVRQ